MVQFKDENPLCTLVLPWILLLFRCSIKENWEVRKRQLAVGPRMSCWFPLMERVSLQIWSSQQNLKFEINFKVLKTLNCWHVSSFDNSIVLKLSGCLMGFPWNWFTPPPPPSVCNCLCWSLGLTNQPCQPNPSSSSWYLLRRSAFVYSKLTTSRKGAGPSLLFAIHICVLLFVFILRNTISRSCDS